MTTILTRQTGILSWRVFIHEVQLLGTVEGSFSLAIQTGREFFFADADLFFSPLANATSSSTKNSSHDRVLFIKQCLHFNISTFFFNSKLRKMNRVWNGLLYKNKDPFERWRCPIGPGSHDQALHIWNIRENICLSLSAFSSSLTQPAISGRRVPLYKLGPDWGFSLLKGSFSCCGCFLMGQTQTFFKS